MTTARAKGPHRRAAHCASRNQASRSWDSGRPTLADQSCRTHFCSCIITESNTPGSPGRDPGLGSAGWPESGRDRPACRAAWPFTARPGRSLAELENLGRLHVVDPREPLVPFHLALEADQFAGREQTMPVAVANLGC